jgi:hypothetical protein
VITELRHLADRHPLREHLHGQLMLALYRDGRQAEALAAYRHARQVLIGELGTEPGTTLRALHQRILTDDTALAFPDPPLPAVEVATPAVPRELPAGVPHFTGRADELAVLSGLLDRSGGKMPETVVIAAIGGTAGVGKTALAVQWAHQVADRFPDGQLYVNLRGYDPLAKPVPPSDAIRCFLRALGVAPAHIPADLDGLAGLYRSLLAGRRMLVLLDNARDAGQVRPLLPGDGGCLVLVTSRDQLAGLVGAEGAHPVILDLLSDSEAWELLTRKAWRDQDGRRSRGGR